VTGTPPAAHPQSRLRLAPVALAALCLLLAIGVTAAPALAAKQKGGRSHGARIEILAPRQEARVGATVVARVRVSTTKGFSASLAGHNVTGRFRRSGGVLEAHLRRGRDYRLGKNSLLIAAGQGRAMRAYTAHFVSRVPDRSLVTVTRLDPRSDHTPLHFRIHVAARVARLKVTVNGRRIALSTLEDRRRTWVVAVGAGDGVRFGSNILRADAERADGRRFDGESVPFKVTRSAPLVSAGPDRRTRPGRAVVLDGGKTQSAVKKGTLAYRWQIVKKPRGSHAGVVDATDRDGRLLPDLPGTYRVRLEVARTTKRAAAERGKQATASSVVTPEPVCLPFVALTPAGSSSELSPLEAPTCVTPTGETSPPPLPADAPSASDEMEVTVPPTIAPMGLPLETISSTGAIQVGRQSYPPQGGFGFAHLIEINKASAQIEGQKTITFEDPAALAEEINDANPNSLTIVAGMGETEQGAVPQAAVESVGAAIGKLHGRVPSNAKLAELIQSGEWSIVGSRELAGYFAANFARSAELTPVEAEAGSKVGSLNGHLQPGKSGVLRYVSTEFIPIDTKAPGSSEVKSVFKLGSEILEAEIPSHSLGLHIGIFNGESASGKLTQLANLNYTLVNNGNTNGQGVEAAAYELKRWRTDPANVLIVMQTYGEEGIAPTTAPSASQYWVNDGLFEPTEYGLFEWKEQPYVKIKHESETEEILDRFWNKEYPTVAGQVGDLTGSAGHDLIANFGIPNVFQQSPSKPKPVEPVEISRLTMVAANHAQNPEANFISGTAKSANGTPEGRLVGVLTRNDEGGWTVQNGSSESLWEAAKIWEVAYAEKTPWPWAEGPTPQGEEDKYAMEAICEELFGKATAIKNLRAEYPTYSANEALSLEVALGRMKFEAKPADKFEGHTYEELRKQLMVELQDIDRVKEAMVRWKSIYGSNNSNIVNVNNVTSKVIRAVLTNTKEQETAEAEVNPEAILSEALYTAADLAGFPEVSEFLKVPEIVGTMAGGVALAEASTPEPEAQTVAPESEEVRVRAGELETVLAKHVEDATEGIESLEKILVSDWGKLSRAGGEATEKWKPEGEVEQALKQSLSVNTERELYEALLPYAYQEWVISPYQTNTNGDGPISPGRDYYCRSYFGENTSPTGKHPFQSEPQGGLSTATYRAALEPGSKAKPAEPYTQPYSIRALKSTKDRLEMVTQTLEGEHKIVAIHRDGSSPLEALVNPLFEPVLTGESALVPERLGINKTEFFAQYGGGPNDWKRTICAQD
jgi:hypothetical protein